MAAIRGSRAPSSGAAHRIDSEQKFRRKFPRACLRRGSPAPADVRFWNPAAEPQSFEVLIIVSHQAETLRHLGEKLQFNRDCLPRSAARKQCYTARFPHMLTHALRRISSVVLALLLLAGPALRVAAQSQSLPLPAAADDFVRTILAHSGSPSAIAVNFQSVSSAAPEAIEAAQTAIFNSFRVAGVRLVKPEQAVAEVQITFSDDWESNDWIAVIREGSTSQTVIRKFARPDRNAASRVPTLTLHKYTVWQQDGRILDFSLDNQNLALLEPDQISFYSSESGQWRGRYTLGIPHSDPWPRDLRGRLRIKDGQITAFLPGTLCTGSQSPPALDCRPSDDPWQIDQGSLVAFYSPRRNFFNGILAGAAGGASVSPFFSGASWSTNGQRQFLFAGTDGRARVYAGDLTTPAAVFNAWGGNVAILNSKCGSGWQVVVTTPSDITQPDAVQAMEITGREAVPVSSPAELSGSVFALWTSARNGDAVNGVMQSPVTGKYEAFVLTVTCN